MDGDERALPAQRARVPEDALRPRRAAVPALSTLPYTEGEAGDWWREAAKYADIVPEVYFNGVGLWKAGPVLASRRLRVAMRRSITRLRDVGIAPERIGVMLGFQTRRGAGGREGLQPDGAWYEVVKWQALAARQVAARDRDRDDLVVGLGPRTSAAQRGEQGRRGMRLLWTRDPSLCDAPALVGDALDVDREEGQIVPARGERVHARRARDPDGGDRLAPPAHRRSRGRVHGAARARRGEPVRGHPDERGADRRARGDRGRLRGQRRRLPGGAAQAGATVTIARAILSDELRRLRPGGAHARAAPSAGEVSAFYFGYPDVLARAVRALPGAVVARRPRAGPRARAARPGAALHDGAGTRTLRALDGAYQVDVLGDVRPLGTIPFPDARGSIAAALRAFARRAAFESWTIRRQEAVLRSAICRGDVFPVAGRSGSRATCRSSPSRASRRAAPSRRRPLPAPSRGRARRRRARRTRPRRRPAAARRRRPRS